MTNYNNIKQTYLNKLHYIDKQATPKLSAITAAILYYAESKLGKMPEAKLISDLYVNIYKEA